MAQGPNSLAPVYFSTAAEIFQWQPSSANPLIVATVPLAPRMVTNEVRVLVGLDNGERLRRRTIFRLLCFPRRVWAATSSSQSRRQATIPHSRISGRFSSERCAATALCQLRPQGRT